MVVVAMKMMVLPSSKGRSWVVCIPSCGEITDVPKQISWTALIAQMIQELQRVQYGGLVVSRRAGKKRNVKGAEIVSIYKLLLRHMVRFLLS